MMSPVELHQGINSDFFYSDMAMTRILISSPNFQTDLEQEYYTGSNIDPISKADYELISSIGTVRVAVATVSLRFRRERRPIRNMGFQTWSHLIR